MKKLQMVVSNSLTFEQGCNKYLDNCRQRNLRDMITTLHFLMNEGYLPHFKMQAIKVDKTNVETYTDDELHILLAKPNIKRCSFIDYQSWVMTNFLFSTGIRQRSLMFIQIKDVDFVVKQN